MDSTQTIALIVILLQVIFLEGVLSLDNAAVLGAVVLSLPDAAVVPWPKFLTGLGKTLHPLLGDQRTAALRVGLLGAYLGRGLMLLMASFIIRNPWLQLVGAAYLIKISAAELGSMGDGGEEEDGGASLREKARGFWSIVVMVELMDLAFSLDNVVVAVSLSSKLWIVMLGVAIGIITMRFAAGLFSKLIEKIPSLSTAAYVLVFSIAIQLVFSRVSGFEINNFTRFAINVGILILAAIYDKIRVIHRPLMTPFRICRYFFYGLDRIFTIVFYPITWTIRKLWDLAVYLFRQISVAFQSAE